MSSLTNDQRNTNEHKNVFLFVFQIHKDKTENN